MGYKMKGSSLYGSGKKPSVKKTDGIGEGFMNPPYRGPESKGPRAKRQGYDGYTNFTSNVTGRKVHKDAPKSTVHGVDNPGNWQPHQFRKKSPTKKRGLWDNIHAKRKRGETMRKKGDKGAPTEKAIKESQSPAKMKKKPTGPRAEKKFQSTKDYNTRARMHNTMEIKDRETNPSYRLEFTDDGGFIQRGRMPRPQRPEFPEFRKKSPVKAKDERVKIDGKMYPKGYTKKDVKFLKSQKEDVVRYEDLDAKGRAIWKKQGKAIPKAEKSPAKFEEVVPRKMPSRIKTRKTPKRKMPKLATGAKIPMALKLRKTEGRGPRA